MEGCTEWIDGCTGCGWLEECMEWVDGCFGSGWLDKCKDSLNGCIDSGELEGYKDRYRFFHLLLLFLSIHVPFSSLPSTLIFLLSFSFLLSFILFDGCYFLLSILPSLFFFHPTFLLFHFVDLPFIHLNISLNQLIKQ